MHLKHKQALAGYAVVVLLSLEMQNTRILHMHFKQRLFTINCEKSMKILVIKINYNLNK